jgi:hypothetical protein
MLTQEDAVGTEARRAALLLVIPMRTTTAAACTIQGRGIIDCLGIDKLTESYLAISILAAALLYVMMPVMIASKYSHR